MPQPNLTSTAAEPKTRQSAKPRMTGPYSRIRSGIKGIDKRTKAARHIARVRAELLAHIGGTASFTQTAIIERAATISVRIAFMEAQTGADGEMSEKNSREYMCWSNAYCRLMAQLGLQAVQPSKSAASPTRPAYLDIDMGAELDEVA
jgi:hypothetical protein